ncbi:hypothetical protein [Paramicrobacterium humi]|uniref:hypothetical protein n=1 Tax=Paramicrobacterium humi TaxID=640635 RepID=UPI00115F8A61|nr:hypothetical protein [Microbacterium humi]
MVASHSVFRGALPRQIDAALAGLAGGFFDAARLPAPPNMPTIREFQFDEGIAALGWLRERLAAHGSKSAGGRQSS